MADKVIDYITGKEVAAKPEEIEAVQPFVKSLVEDYGYPKSHIITHPQYRVKCRPSDTKKEYPVDIAVFSDKAKTDDDIYIIVECKKKNRKDGRSQLEDYLRLSKAQLGVWFNGEERFFLRKYEKDGKCYFEEVPNIPNFGQKIEEVGKFLRKDLKPTHNLKSTFKTIRNYLAGNAIGATSDDVLAQQLINIIFCKIYDERFTDPDGLLSFRAGFGENPDDVKKRIDELFENVKKKYKEVIYDNDKITIDSVSVTYVVGELQNYCLMDTERDVVADAFEVFIGHALKGDKGQFFTPRNVIKMIIEILNPSDDDFIIDPACGSGGFLIEALRYVWNKIEAEGKKLHWNAAAIQEEKIAYASTKIRGIDKDAFLTKITKAYMAILGDGKGGIFCEDSLDNPSTWHADTKVKIGLNSFSMVATNPPFGASINIVGEEKLKQYEFGYKFKDDEKTTKLKDKENPQILFIERDLQLLRDGGKMAIVLPETYLHAPSVKYVIKHLEKKHNIFAVVDLPHNTFRPHCNAKCAVLFIQKNRPQQDEIVMGIVQEMGHNHQGRPIYRFDEEKLQFTNEIWDDTPIVAEEFKHPDNPNNRLVFKVKKEDIVNSLYVPRYYWTKRIEFLEELAKKQNCTLIPFKKILDEGIVVSYKGHGAPPSEFKGTGDVFYVRAGDIIEWDIFRNPTSSVPVEVYEKGIKGKVKLEPLDILFVKEGSYRVGDVALLSPNDTGIFLNHHTLVFKVSKLDNQYGINPYYLLYLLSHHLTKMQFFNKIMIDTTLPNIGDRWKELLLPVSNDAKIREEITNELKAAFEQKWGVQQNFDRIKKKFNS